MVDQDTQAHRHLPDPHTRKPTSKSAKDIVNEQNLVNQLLRLGSGNPMMGRLDSTDLGVLDVLVCNLPMFEKKVTTPVIVSMLNCPFDYKIFICKYKM